MTKPSPVTRGLECVVIWRDRSANLRAIGDSAYIKATLQGPP